MDLTNGISFQYNKMQNLSKISLDLTKLTDRTRPQLPDPYTTDTKTTQPNYVPNPIDSTEHSTRKRQPILTQPDPIWLVNGLTKDTATVIEKVSTERRPCQHWHNLNNDLIIEIIHLNQSRTDPNTTQPEIDSTRINLIWTTYIPSE